MALREFTDARGNRWTVWSTRPDSRSALPSELHEGWLTFECGRTRKRLIPIPRDWEEVSAERLGLYCGAAERLAGSRRSRPIDIQSSE
jgi:hypothetical protein